jgi:hypothetical protein
VNTFVRVLCPVCSRASRHVTVMFRTSILSRRRGVVPRTSSKFAGLAGYALVTLLVLWCASQETVDDLRGYRVPDVPHDPNTLSSTDTPPLSSFTDHSERTIPTVAYAVSLIKCGDRHNNADGLSDAAAVLRHSIHRHSVRDSASASRYDYKMYAIVHEQATECADPFHQLGFEVLVRAPPVQTHEIRNEYLRTHIHREVCCGADEFVKLYAYQITEHPVVVHVDIDFVLHRPLDDLFDVLINNDSAAQARVDREFPDTPWPARTDAFMTRDWSQVIPGRKPGYQAGFIAHKPDPVVFEELVHVIKTANYTEGFGRGNGWGGLGYGTFVGAMAMQGLLAYYYDIKHPDRWVELNQCRHNHMGMDIRFRGPPGFRANHPNKGKCRNNRETCEDCMYTDPDEIYSIHFSPCRKPWNCVGESARRGSGFLPEGVVDPPHCRQLLRIWHDLRTDLEQKLHTLTGDETIRRGQTGTFMPDTFMGHCNGHGPEHYLSLSGTPETLVQIPNLYQK